MVWRPGDVPHDPIPLAEMSQPCNCVHKLPCYCQANRLFPSSLVLILSSLILVFFRGQEGEKVVAASQADIPAALRTVFCKLLFELQSFYITNSQVMRRWGKRRGFQWLISLLGTRMSDGCCTTDFTKGDEGWFSAGCPKEGEPGFKRCWGTKI